MKPRHSHKKLFLPAGLVSLILSPVFFYAYTREFPTKANTTIEINLPPADWKNFVHLLGLDIPPDGTWDRFDLNEDLAANASSMRRFQTALRTFVSQHDTAKGIHVRLSRQASYDSFVQVIDMLGQEGISRWSILNGDVLVHRFQPAREDTSRLVVICGGVVSRFLTASEAKSSWSEIFNRYDIFFHSDIKYVALVLFLAWLAMLATSIRQLHRLKVWP